MSLRTTHSNIHGVILIRLSGAIYFGEESTSLRSLVKGLLNDSRQMVLDLGEVNHIDSGGLGTLVSLAASARKTGGEIRLARLGDHARELLQITRIMALFEIFETVEDAIASFNKAAAAG